MLNHIVLQGNLCNDPELRYIPSTQTPTCAVTLAVTRDYAKDGQQTTDFIDVVTYRKTAEFLSRYFMKGSAAIVSGRLQIRLYKDKDGVARRATEVAAEHVWFGESRRSAEAPAEPTRYVSNPPDYTGAFPAAPSGFDYQQTGPSSYCAARPVNVAPPFEDLDDEPGELPF